MFTSWESWAGLFTSRERPQCLHLQKGINACFVKLLWAPMRECRVWHPLRPEPGRSPISLPQGTREGWLSPAWGSADLARGALASARVLSCFFPLQSTAHLGSLPWHEKTHVPAR